MLAKPFDRVVKAKARRNSLRATFSMLTTVFSSAPAIGNQPSFAVGKSAAHLE